MYKIKSINQGEPPSTTFKFIESKNNWDVELQKNRILIEEFCNINLSECNIYWRGIILIIEHNNIIPYWEMLPYCFLEKAVKYMNPNKTVEWKTLYKLITIRMALHQPTFYIKYDLLNDILEGKEMTIDGYNQFVKFAREHELQFNGKNTF